MVVFGAEGLGMVVVGGLVVVVGGTVVVGSTVVVVASSVVEVETARVELAVSWLISQKTPKAADAVSVAAMIVLVRLCMLLSVTDSPPRARRVVQCNGSATDLRQFLTIFVLACIENGCALPIFTCDYND